MVIRNKIVNNWEQLPVALNINTVGIILGVNESTVKRWLSDGTIKGTKIGKKWIISKDYIKALVGDE